MKLSIVVPAHNEAGNLEILLPRLKKALSHLEAEIVIVDNASTDNTDEVLQTFGKITPELHVVKEPVLGYGRAVITGLESTEGDVIGIIRADNQEKSEDLAEIYERLQKGRFDLYKAVRKNRIRDGLVRVIVSKAYNLLFRILFRLKIKDVNATPKVFTRELYEKMKLESKDWFIDAEIVIKAGKLKCKIGEMEIEYLPRLKGQSKVKTSHIIEFLKNMLYWRNRINDGEFLAG